MIALSIIYFLFMITFVSILIETGMAFYKNSRFWLLLLAFMFLVGMTGRSVF